MDLDPRLRPDQGEQVGASPATSGPGTSSTPSPSSQLNTGGFSNTSAPSRGHHGPGAPETPSSLGTPDNNKQQQNRHEDQELGDDQDGADAKKSRACEACRGLKVRCEPDPNDEGPCKRCKKAGRNCVVTMPTRKRQKKTDSRVSELEKKIDALTASLQARTTAPGTSGSPILGFPSNPPPPMSAGLQRAVPDTSGGYGTVWANPPARTSWGGEAQAQEQAREQASRFTQPPATMAGQKRKMSEYGDATTNQQKQSASATAGWSHTSNPGEGDIVDTGVISTEKAAEMFSRYKDQMIRHMPGVIFPPSTTILELRRTKPTLFLAIMAAAMTENHALQKVLQKDLLQIFAHKIIVQGEKSLELVQALQVAVIWYWPPEHFEELKFYQLVHIAAVMAIDIGLGRKSPPRRDHPVFTWREQPHPVRRQPPPDAMSIECRRAWLTCYFLTTNTSMTLHRPNLVRWSPFMSESVEILEASADAAPTDKYLCHLVWTHRQAEEVSNQFSMDDPATTASIIDVRTQFALRALERDLDKYRASVPKELLQPTLRISFDVLNLYMHEMALHSATAYDQWRPPFSTAVLEDSLMKAEPLSAAHVNALSACLTAIDGIFETFLSLDVTSVRCLPIFNFVRVAYAVVILMKMYCSASSPGSELGRVINKDNMRVEHHLEALLEKFRATAADDKCRPASKFLLVLAMLRSWFFRQGKRDGKAVTPKKGEDSASHLGQQQQQHHQPQQQQQTANTPLQLLSEVATGRDPSARNIYNPIPSQQPFYQDGSSTDTPSTTTTNQQSLPSDMDATSFPPWMGQGISTDLDLTMIPPGMDLETLGLDTDFSDAYESGAKMVLNEPWFNDMFQGLPDPNLFSF